MTGGTGFLGAFLVHGLLVRGDVTVYALVRAKDNAAATSRLLSVLRGFGLWEERFSARLHALAGDLGKPRFGFAAETFDRLADDLDVVYHAGAVVNLVFPYTMLKPANVLGTEEVLRLVTRGRSKWLHYVSTNGFFLAPEYAGRSVPEDDPASETAHLLFGYMQTKWVAEKLVLAARDRGVPVSLYRPTFIGWHAQSGVYNNKDFMCALIDGCLELGVAPELDLLVEVASVDFVAAAILKLGESETSIGKAFNVGNPERVPWHEVVALCGAQGWPLRTVPYAEWRALLSQSRSNPAYGFHSMLPDVGVNDGTSVGEALSSRSIPRLGFDNIRAGLKDSGIVCPHLDGALLGAHIAHLRARKAHDVGEAGARSFSQWGPR